MKSYHYILLLFFSLLAACHVEEKISEENQNVLEYVNPFIGTDGHGHTFPGAAVPFGMVQLSPDTHLAGWDWCSGYHYTDSSIIGFSHTHLSGTGRSDLMDVLLMPTTGTTKVVPGTRENPDGGYRSRFSHDEEWASPGYYKVKLLDYDILAELTVTPRCGFHKYTFPKTRDAHILLDLFHHYSTDSVKESSLRIQDNQTLTGMRRSKGWGEPGEKYWSNQQLFFVVRFSKPFNSCDLFIDNQIVADSCMEANGRNLKVILNYETGEREAIFVKVGISSVSIENAILNLDAEIPAWDFDGTVARARSSWNQKLSQIQIDASEEEKTKIYTAMYHSFLAPYLFSDINNEYWGFDKQVHKTTGSKHYTVMSLWDTFRAVHPLFTLFAPEVVNDIVASMLRQYDEYGLLPVWPLWGSETNCMIGYHAIPVIVDAYLKGFRDFDVEKAYQAMKTSAMQDDFGINYLKKYGYIPYDKYNKSVATALEYCYDDWCIARLAKELGKTDDYHYFMKRAASYSTYFDKEYKLMNGVSSTGKFRRPFDPFYSSYGECDWVEGNSWQYSFFVPHDVQGIINLFGSNQEFVNALDTLFGIHSHVSGEDVPLDISGFIGQYVHGNEPSHQVAYLYNYAGVPWKSQEKLHEIMTTLYTTSPDGLCGNEDCGQMSAWYVFSALGFYPVNPAEGGYVLGKPMINGAILNVGNKRFEIVVKNMSPENIYIQSVTLNGEEYNKLYIRHQDILDGGILEFYMGASPSPTFGTSVGSVPPSVTNYNNEGVYTLSVCNNTLSVSSKQGGRILSSTYNGREILVPSSVHQENYGATLWPSPQSNWGWPPYPVLDLEAYEGSMNKEGSLVLVSQPDLESGFRFQKKFTPCTADTSFQIEYTISNISSNEKKVAAWDVCRTKGGVSFFPVGEEVDLPVSTLKGTSVSNGILWYRFNKDSITEPQKLFSTAQEGWLAHLMGDLLFVKNFPNTKVSELPPGQGEVEIFAQEGGLYIELENHGPYTNLKPGEYLTYMEKWYLRKVNPASIPSDLVGMVKCIVD